MTNGTLRFAVVICFDFIGIDRARLGGPLEALLNERLDLLLIPECNPTPLHNLYAKRMIVAFEGGKWLNSPPHIAFANVSGGSELKDCGGFGRSRIAGRFGSIAPLPIGVSVVSGDVQEVNGKMETFSDPLRQTILANCDAAVIDVKLQIGDPNKNPRMGRVDTNVTAYRMLKGKPTFRRQVEIRSSPAQTHEHQGIPSGHLVPDGLVGFEEFVDDICSRLEKNRRVWVSGSGSSGKTAAVAQAISTFSSSRKWLRLFWVDCEGLEPEQEDALAEVIALMTGRTAAMDPQNDGQTRWSELVKGLVEQPSLLVLDSFEKWARSSEWPDLEAKSQLWSASLWPLLLVVTSRVVSGLESDITQPPELSPDAVRELINRGASSELSNDTIELISNIARSSPLGAHWMGTLGPDHVRSISLDSSREQHIKYIFEALLRGRTLAFRRVLDALCFMPTSVTVDWLNGILQMPDVVIEEHIKQLERLHLAAKDQQGWRPRHPFIREYWRDIRRSEDTTTDLIVDWAKGLILRYGGDRNWDHFHHLEAHWYAIHAVLRHLEASEITEDCLSFLTIWRGVDYFLWCKVEYRRLRERLGRQAMNVAERCGDKARLAHACFDSVAETAWTAHKTADIEDLLTKAEGLFRELGDDAEKARVRWYRGRYLRMIAKQNKDKKRLHQAKVEAEGAVNDADLAKSDLVSGHARNGLANILRDMGSHDEALKVYNSAIPYLELAKDREMLGIVKRNLGRVHLAQSEFEEAIEHLSEAIEELSSLSLTIEKAEAEGFLAQVLFKAGDVEEAMLLRDAARWVFRQTGAVHHLKELEETLADLPETPVLEKDGV